MNKLSGIIASTPRVAAVDLSGTPTRRAGTPSFGMRSSRAAGRLEGSSLSAYERLQKMDLLPNSKTFEGAHEVKISNEMTDKFFKEAAPVEKIEMGEIQLDKNSHEFVKENEAQGIQEDASVKGQMLSLEV